MLYVVTLEEKHVCPQHIIKPANLSSYITVVLNTLLVLGKAVATLTFSLGLRPFCVGYTTGEEFGDISLGLTGDKEIVLLCDGRESDVRMM